MERLTRLLRAGDLDVCESAAIEALLVLPKSPIHIVADPARFVFVSKFQRSMQLASASMKELHVPLYTTAHDFDYIAQISLR